MKQLKDCSRFAQIHNVDFVSVEYSSAFDNTAFKTNGTSSIKHDKLRANFDWVYSSKSISDLPFALRSFGFTGSSVHFECLWMSNLLLS